MIKASTAERLAARLSDAYGIAADAVRSAIDAQGLPTGNVDIDGIAIERHGDELLLIDAGEIAASLDLSGILPPVASACDTLDPYGDREDVLVAPSIHDPHAPRISPAGNL